MAKLLTKMTRAEPTYVDVGCALTGSMPPGYQHDRYATELGVGDEAFQLATNGLRTWQVFHVPGVRVHPSSDEVRVGATVLLTYGLSILSLAVPCRIITVIDEPTRFGFAYGTLPGHPEQGEEGFMITKEPSGAVTLTITAFSRPVSVVARLFGPISRRVQVRITEGYLRALRDYTSK